MILHKQKPATPWLLIVLFAIVAASSILLGIIYYKSHKRSLVRNKGLELSAIADLKVNQIAQWRNERLSDARLIGGNTPFVKLLYNYLHEEDPSGLYPEIASSLKSLAVNVDYKDVVLIDSLGKIVIKIPGNDTLCDGQIKIMLPELMKLRTGILTDFIREKNIDPVNLHLVVPLVNTWRNDSSAFGLLLKGSTRQRSFF